MLNLSKVSMEIPQNKILQALKLSFLKWTEAELYLLQTLCLLLLLVATLGSSDLVPLPPPLPPLALLRCQLKTRGTNIFQHLTPKNHTYWLSQFHKIKVTTCCSSPPPHLSPASRPAGEVLVGSVWAGAGTVWAHVGAEPVGQPLVLDGEAQLLFHDRCEVGEVVQGERARRGQAGDHGGAADVSQRGTRVLQHHSENTRVGLLIPNKVAFFKRNYFSIYARHIKLLQLQMNTVYKDVVHKMSVKMKFQENKLNTRTL